MAVFHIDKLTPESRVWIYGTDKRLDDRQLDIAEQHLIPPYLSGFEYLYYRRPDGSVNCVDRSAFRDHVARGEVTEKTIVFDNTVQTLGQLRNGNWQKPMRESWHYAVFAAAEVE